MIAMGRCVALVLVVCVLGSLLCIFGGGLGAVHCSGCWK
jgi:hypothetical protein